MSVNPPRIALVVPVYNEADLITRSLPEILAKAREAAPGSMVELIAVDDGSKDGSRASLAALAAQEPAIHFVSFTRNFGKEAAIHAGLAQALDRTGASAVIVIDADLQHPPELMAQMLRHWREGAKVVEAVKRARGDEGPLRRIAARTFYSIFTRMSGLRLDQDTDYKLLDREVVVAALALGERARFFRGIVRWLGFPTVQVPFDVAPRAGGATSWSLASLARYAWRNLTSFSSAPLGLVTTFGAVGLAVGGVLAVKAVIDKLQGLALSGFSTVILLQVIFSSLILLSLGIIGSYIALIYDELKRRPHYIIRPGDLAGAPWPAPAGPQEQKDLAA
ncbi:MAG: glycosyltransferase family 2 protein [Ramlibacter sp.]|nr:glycosyltransferase family 2 protein [Ramlibacter sp.]